jgi:hypothetical protein
VRCHSFGRLEKYRLLPTLTKVTVGYVHAVAVDGQLSLASSMGLWLKHNLDMQFIEFQNGIEAFQTMTAGNLDMLVTGGVISHYPAMGQGKVFLMNDIEYDCGAVRAADQCSRSLAFIAHLSPVRLPASN